jgi:hypothetical protein
MKASPIFATLTAAVLMFGAVPVLRADDGGKGPGSNSGSGNSNTSQIRLRTNLAGAAIAGKKPEGNADFRNDGTRMRLNVELENVNLAAGTVLTVQVTLPASPASTVGSITPSATSESELEIDSQNGGVVPAIVPGTMVTVLNGTTVILAGVF